MALRLKPFEYQQRGIDYAYKHYWTLNGDEQGLGKTLQALGLIDRVGGERNMVVCPAMLRGTWAKEIEKVLPEYVDKIEIVSYDMFRKAEPFKLDCLIFDEAHYLKNSKSYRGRAAMDWSIVSPPRYLLMLSGTPIKNKVTEFFTLIYILSGCPFEANGIKWRFGYWHFCNTFARREKLPSYHGREIYKYEGLKNLSKLKLLLKNKYIRRLARNNLELPPLIRKDVWVENKKIDKSLERAWKEFENDGHFSTLKADCALGKTKFTIKYCLDILEEGNPIVVFSDHRDPVFAIEKGLLDGGFRVATIMGGVKESHRNSAVENFQAGNLDALVVTIQAASVGITLTKSNHIICNDLPWVPADLQQMEKRIHRIGQDSTAFIHYILAGQMDRGILSKLLEKSELLRKAASAHV